MTSTVYMRLDQIQKVLNLYALPVLYVLGNVTNLINIRIFSHPRMRMNSCSWYFICLSLSHLLLLNSFCLPRIIVVWTGVDLAADSSAYCRIRAYLFNLSLLFSRQFITLITIDRWVVTSSSVWLRNQSSPKTTRWLIIGSVMFWSLYNLHSLIGYGSNPNGCYPTPGTFYSLFSSIDAIATMFPPVISMITFSLLTLHNLRSSGVRQIQANIVPVTAIILTPAGQKRRSKRNSRFLQLSLVQVLVFVILNSGWTSFAIFAAIPKPAILSVFNQIYLSTFLQTIAFTLLYLYAAVRLLNHDTRRVHIGFEKLSNAMPAAGENVVEHGETVVSEPVLNQYPQCCRE